MCLPTCPSTTHSLRDTSLTRVLAATFVYIRHGPRTVGSEHMGPELLAFLLGLLGRSIKSFVGTFLLLCPVRLG